MMHFGQPARQNHISRVTAGSGGLQWQLALFLTVVFFLTNQDLFFSQMFTGNSHFGPGPTAKAITEGSPRREIAYLALGIFGVVTLFRRRHLASKFNGWLGGFIAIYLSWSFLSIFWAEDISLTARRLIVLLMLCLGAVAASRQLWKENLVKFTLYSTGSYLIVGIIAEIILGTFHPSTEGYRFAGTTSPNHEGWYCALFLLASVCASRNKGRGRLMFQLCAGIGFVLLVLTGSRTAFASVIVSLLVYWSLVWSRSRKRAAVFSAGVGLTLFLFLFFGTAAPDLESAVLLGRVSSPVVELSGRLPLWQVCLESVSKHPLLGYGYGGFWTGSRTVEISKMLHWVPSDAHSMYLNSLLNLGAIGALALLFIFLLGINRSISLYRKVADPHFAFAAVILLFCAVDGVMESITSQPELPLFLCMLVLARLGFRSIPRGKRLSVKGPLLGA